jgi:hypothetical protein
MVIVAISIPKQHSKRTIVCRSLSLGSDCPFRAAHVSEGLRPSPLQGFNAIDPCPSRDSSVGVPQEVQRYLSGEDRPPLSVGQIHDLGMALAKMHYKVSPLKDCPALQITTDARWFE